MLALTLAPGLVSEARAEIVHLISGRTLSIKSHRVEGSSIVLTLRTGGEVTCDRSLIDKIVSDEVPYPEPVTEAATGGTGPGARGGEPPGGHALR